jgi:hypothetical protein
MTIMHIKDLKDTLLDVVEVDNNGIPIKSEWRVLKYAWLHGFQHYNKTMSFSPPFWWLQ